MKMKDKLLTLAVEEAVKRSHNRHFLVGAAALRSDGAIVTSRNERSYTPGAYSHAETKVLKKAGWGALVVLVARVQRDGSISTAKPCKRCEALLISRGVQEILYTNSVGEINKL